MADPTTPLGFVLPTVGGDRDSWGDLTNANWHLADSLIKTLTDSAGSGDLANLIANIKAYIEPIGSMKIWPMPSAPLGWISCDGIALSRTDWSELFAVIGTTWGAGNGSTTFNIPDLKGLVPVHCNGWLGFGQVFGSTVCVLDQFQLPPHTHSGGTSVVPAHTHRYTGYATAGAQITGGATQIPFYPEDHGTSGDNEHGHTFTTDAGPGQSNPHNNVQPSRGVNIIIKAGHAWS
jgi:microcystin-dependent protein